MSRDKGLSLPPTPLTLLDARESLRVLVKPHFTGRNRLDRIENDLAERIAVDVKRGRAPKSFSERKALFSIGLRKL